MNNVKLVNTSMYPVSTSIPDVTAHPEFENSWLNKVEIAWIEGKVQAIAALKRGDVQTWNQWIAEKPSSLSRQAVFNGDTLIDIDLKGVRIDDVDFRSIDIDEETVKGNLETLFWYAEVRRNEEDDLWSPLYWSVPGELWLSDDTTPEKRNQLAIFVLDVFTHGVHDAQENYESYKNNGLSTESLPALAEPY